MKRRKWVKWVIVYSLLLMFLVIALFPVYWMGITSFKTQKEIYSPVPTFWPKSFTFSAYKEMLFERGFLQNIKNSLIVACSVTIISAVLSYIAAYAIVKLDFPGRKFSSKAVLYAYLLPRTILYIPLYLLVSKLGLSNSLWGLILIYPTFTIPYATWMLIAYLKSIPIELEEAAEIDGCNKIQSMIRIALPMSLPGVMSTVIFMFTMCWSEYLYALVVVQEAAKKTITLALSNMMIGDVFSWGPLMAGSIICTIPVLIMYMVSSKYLVTGTTAGAVKG
ncbi:MAG: carbohydrate ABC transporter permease [Clostridia bacterium]